MAQIPISDWAGQTKEKADYNLDTEEASRCPDFYASAAMIPLCFQSRNMKLLLSTLKWKISERGEDLVAAGNDGLV